MEGFDDHIQVEYFFNQNHRLNNHALETSFGSYDRQACILVEIHHYTHKVKVDISLSVQATEINEQVFTLILLNNNVFY